MSGRDDEILDNDHEDDRTPRSVETREHDLRQQDWQQADLLPTPTPQPGWSFRWIRVSMLGEGDATNVSLRFREGWVPVRAKDHPELMYFNTNDPKSRWKDNVELGGLILCKIATKAANQRAQHMRDRADQQMEAVDNSLMKESDARMPILKPERRTRSSFGSGRKP
jgi:hypothetical protein